MSPKATPRRCKRSSEQFSRRPEVQWPKRFAISVLKSEPSSLSSGRQTRLGRKTSKAEQWNASSTSLNRWPSETSLPARQLKSPANSMTPPLFPVVYCARVCALVVRPLISSFLLGALRDMEDADVYSRVHQSLCLA